MSRYDNFETALYFTTRCIEAIGTIEEFAADFAFFEKHIRCSKVYLETHRDDMDVPAEKLEALKSFFSQKGIKASGAITTTFMKTIKNKAMIDETGVFGCGGTVLEKYGKHAPQIEKGSKRTWRTICYTDEASRNELKEIVRLTASLFDEIILDDFYFTNCTCPSCIRAKGEQSWEEFRLELMTGVSRDLVIGPAKEVNPNVSLIIKYPNWYEAYQETGYNTETQPFLFDPVYTGTETRDTNHTMQHLPRYGSYSLMRWFENLKPGRNGGGWIDHYHSIHNLGYYLEQAFLTFFAKGRELTLFCYSWLLDTVYLPPLGLELEHLDRVIGKAGSPVGIPVYEPFHAHGEDHLYDYLGMAGLAFEPQPCFPETGELVFLTADSARDEKVLERLKGHLMAGGDACITSGFLKAMEGKGIREFTSACHTGRKVCSRDYVTGGAGSVHSGEFMGREAVVLPQVDYMNNSADCLIAIRKEDSNFPVLLRNWYGEGTLYILTIPDDYADVYKFPAEVLTVIRQYLMSDLGVYLECGEKTGLFLYDNNAFIVESFLDHDVKIKIHLAGKGKRLADARTGALLDPITVKGGESVFEVPLSPVFYKLFTVIG